jgi:hypothetical protein
MRLQTSLQRKSRPKGSCNHLAGTTGVYQGCYQSIGSNKNNKEVKKPSLNGSQDGVKRPLAGARLWPLHIRNAFWEKWCAAA